MDTLRRGRRVTDKKVGGKKALVTTAMVFIALLSSLVALPRSLMVQLSR